MTSHSIARAVLRSSRFAARPELDTEEPAVAAPAPAQPAVATAVVTAEDTMVELEEENPREARLEAELDAFKQYKRALSDYAREHQDVLVGLASRVAQYNASINGVKESIRAFGTDALPPIDLAGFSRTKQSVSVSYDITKLPEEVLAMPGIVKKTEVVDKAVLEALTKAGAIDAAITAEAKVETPGTASIKGPGEISLGSLPT